MNKKMMLWTVLCAACSANAPVAAPDETHTESQQTKVEALSVPNLTSVRELLTSRIDASRLALGPIANVEKSVSFDASRARAALEKALGSPIDALWEGGVWTGKSGTHVVSFDEDDGMITVETDEPFRTGVAHASEELIEATARELFSALAPDSVATKLETVHVGATERDLVKGEVIGDERVATKVFALRTLGGLRVAGHRMVATYHTDGVLRTVRGKWPALDLDASKLSSSLSAAEATTRAVEVLLQHGIAAAGEGRIALESFYAVENAEKGLRVVLRGAALVPTPEGRTERHEFEL